MTLTLTKVLAGSKVEVKVGSLSKLFVNEVHPFATRGTAVEVQTEGYFVPV